MSKVQETEDQSALPPSITAGSICASVLGPEIVHTYPVYGRDFQVRQTFNNAGWPHCNVWLTVEPIDDADRKWWLDLGGQS